MKIDPKSIPNSKSTSMRAYVYLALASFVFVVPALVVVRSRWSRWGGGPQNVLHSEESLFVPSFNMLLLTEGNNLLPLSVSGDDNALSPVTFGNLIVPEDAHLPPSFPSSEDSEDAPEKFEAFVVAIDPQSGAIAYAYTRNTVDNNKSILLRYQGAVHEQTRSKTIEIPIPGYPDSLHVFESAVYLGIANTVGWINFASHSPEYKQLIQRDHAFKAYDMFARQGDLLVAVDDIITPLYADSFRLKGSQHVPSHNGDWILPHGPNHSLKRTAVNDGHLMLLGRHYACHGRCYGQFLHRFDMKESKSYQTLRDHDVVHGSYRQLLQEGGDYFGPHDIVSPYNQSDMDIDRDLDWIDLAVTRRGEIAIAALDRGLCVVPPGPFKSNEPYQTIDLGGRVRAVNTCGTATWVMVANNNNDGTPSSHLVKLDSSWSELAKVASPVNPLDFLAG